MTAEPLSSARTPGSEFVRDRLAGLLLLLNRATAEDIGDQEFVAALREFDVDGDWIGELTDGPDTAGIAASLPHWLTVAGNSGLALVAGAYFDGDVQDTAAEPSAPFGSAGRSVTMRRVLDELGSEVVEQLSQFWAECPEPPSRDDGEEAENGGAGTGPRGSAVHAAVLDVPGGRLAITLTDAPTAAETAAVARPVPEDPLPVDPPGWLRPMEWAGPHLAAAWDAVAGLLGRFGAAVPAGRPPLPAGAWPASWPGEDPAIGLGYALGILAEATGLPRPDVLAVGAWTVGQKLVPMREVDLSGRVKALGQAGVTTVLAPTKVGWVVAGPGGRRTSPAGVPAEPTLDAAATAVWGERWASWKRARHLEELARLGWVPDPMEPRPGDTPMDEADKLLAFFGEQPKPGSAGEPGNAKGRAGEQAAARKRVAKRRRLAVVGGTTRSGKTTIARLTAEKLRRQGWQVQAIRSRHGELPDRDPLLEACHHATALLNHDGSRPFLLILDGFLPLQSGNNAVGALLPMVSESVRASVLAVLEYDLSAATEWKTENIDIVPALVGKPRLKNFVERASSAHPGILDRRSGLAEVEREGGTRDVGVLIRKMSSGGGDDPLLACFDRLGLRQMDAVARTAAVSLIHMGVPEESLTELTDDEREALGIESLPGQDLARMASAEDSERVLRRVLQIEEDPDVPDLVPLAGEGRVRAKVVDLVLPGVEKAMRDTPREVPPWLLGARLYRAWVAAELVDRTRADALDHWLWGAQAAELARCLTVLGSSLDERTTGDFVLQFTNRLGEDPSPLRLHDLKNVVRGIRHAMSTGALDFNMVASWLHVQVNAAISSGEGTAQERLDLLSLIEWFQSAELNEIIVKRVAEVVTDLRPTRAADYFLVLQALRLQRRLWRRVAEDTDVHYEDAAGYHPVDQEPGPELLIEYRAKAEDGFAVILAGMMLRRQVERTEWAKMIDEYQHLLQPALDHSSPRDVIVALQELRRTSGMHRNEIFKRAVDTRWDRGRYLDALRALLRRASPMEAVELLRVVQSLHAWCACLLLSTPAQGQRTAEPVSDKDFVRNLAKAVRTDPRAAGMLLSVTYAVEDPYHQHGKTFAQRLGDAFGEQTVAEWLQTDPRPSVKYYVVKGLWEAQVWYRGACLELMVDIVTQALTTSRRVWGPRLALRLGSDLELGAGFLESLRKKVGIDDLMAGMSIWSPPEAQAEFHRLARALYPNAPRRYAQTFDVRELAQRLANAPTVPAAEACREIARTLRHTGGISGAALLQKTGKAIGRPDVWRDRLDSVRSGGEFTQLLRVLDRTDRGFAGRLLTSYGTDTMKSVHSEKEKESRLVWRTRSEMYNNPVGAAGLFAALEDIAGLGEPIYQGLTGDAVLMKIFTEELQLLQDPSAQYMAALHLARIGVGPRQALNADWTTMTFELKKLIITTVSSPRVIRDILRTMALWERRWALELVPKIDHAKLRRRLRLGVLADLEPAVGLAALLTILDDNVGAPMVLDALKEVGWARVVEHVHLPLGVLLLRLAVRLQPQHAGAVASAVNDRIVSLLSREIVLDDRAVWLEVGHACQALNTAGFDLRNLAGPSVREPLIADAPAVARALSRLPATPWRKRHQTLAVDRLLSHPPRSPQDVTLGLAGAAAAGRLGELLERLGDLSRLSEAATRDLADLTEFAERQPDLAAALHPYRACFEANLQAAASVASMDARRLRQSITRLSFGRMMNDAS
ncbi:hypothetical protein J7F02_09140 [Streptomyces sp. ISL-112]|uniref:hypothetical protein n=1 Tax=unclassified Streptomyces TaxID=2593676 RepID=UPI001BE7FCD4|nr:MULTISPECIES: hypothetical protein [unclassified Streptomyces]MBT2425836.1 hypothetical protein [Streptomyces sp. ISL-112]MBT2460819.1 hypothetical protein [Streptomyces sp. ISL-63]